MYLEADLSKLPATKTIYLNTDLASLQPTGKEHHSALQGNNVKLDGLSQFFTVSGEHTEASKHFPVEFQHDAHPKVREEKILQFTGLCESGKPERQSKSSTN